MLHIERETNLHLTYCEGFGISRQEMEATEEMMACTAYTRSGPTCSSEPFLPSLALANRRLTWGGHRYVLDIGQSEDWLALQVALAPCLLGYGAVAKMLHGDARSKRAGNRYWNWIENYVADDYTQAVRTGSGEPPPLAFPHASLSPLLPRESKRVRWLTRARSMGTLLQGYSSGMRCCSPRLV